MNWIRRKLSKIWYDYCKWTEIAAWTDMCMKGGITTEEYNQKIEEIEKRYDRINTIERERLTRNK